MTYELKVVGILFLLIVIVFYKSMRSTLVAPILEAIDTYQSNRSGLTFYFVRRSGYSGYSEMSEWQRAHEEYIKQEELWKYCVSAMWEIEKAGHYEVAWFLMDAGERKKWTSFLEDFSNTYCALSKAQEKLQEFKS